MREVKNSQPIQDNYLCNQKRIEIFIIEASRTNLTIKAKKECVKIIQTINCSLVFDFIVILL